MEVLIASLFVVLFIGCAVTLALAESGSTGQATVFLAACIAVAMVIGGLIKRAQIEHQAIKLGHAEYVLNGDAAEWRWKEVCDHE